MSEAEADDKCREYMMHTPSRDKDRVFPLKMNAKKYRRKFNQQIQKMLLELSDM